MVNRYFSKGVISHKFWEKLEQVRDGKGNHALGSARPLRERPKDAKKCCASLGVNEESNIAG